MLDCYLFFFFFQAEDGIRDIGVTGVQTCALPISRSATRPQELTDLDSVLPLAKELLKTVDYEQHPIRLIGLSVSHPKEEGPEQHGVWEQLSFEFSDWE